MKKVTLSEEKPTHIEVSAEGPPYGYLHIRKVYADNSWWIEAHVDDRHPEIAENVKAMLEHKYGLKE